MKFFFLLSILVPLSSFASFNDDYNAIKDSGRNLVVIGSVCEEVARVQVQRKYSAQQYTVLTSIGYWDQQRQIGELDITVFKKPSNQVVLIGEVKCWNDMAGGLQKAYTQRQRFFDTVKSNHNLTFAWEQNPSVHFSEDQFSSVTRFITIAQKGSRSMGYDMELDYSLEELMHMRQMVMSCQSQGQCKSPGRN